MAGRLEGKVGLVTGAGSVGPGWGNGRAITVRFIEEGARVFAVDLNSSSLEETVERAGVGPDRLRTHEADVTSSAAVRAMVAACLDAFGRIDILVNNVGGSRPGGCVDLPEEVFDAQVAFNLKSVFLTCKHVLPVMQRQKSGAIVSHRLLHGRLRGVHRSPPAADHAPSRDPDHQSPGTPVKGGVIVYRRGGAIVYRSDAS